MTQVSEAPARTRAQIKERTLRTDPWWNRGRVVATLLTIWVAYATVRVFTGHWYYVPQYHYLTPFYSPCVSGECVAGRQCERCEHPSRGKHARHVVPAFD